MQRGFTAFSFAYRALCRVYTGRRALASVFATALKTLRCRRLPTADPSMLCCSLFRSPCDSH